MSQDEDVYASGSPIRKLIDRLELIPHPEGGWYRETWRSGVRVGREALPAGYPADRSLMTSILYLLPTGARSRRHRVRSEELWLHHRGDDLRLTMLPGEGAGQERPQHVLLGQGDAARLQVIVPPGDWQEAEALGGEAGYALVACVVAPGFEFADFEMADSEEADGAKNESEGARGSA